MDSKGVIKDPTLRIIPSEKLYNYLLNLAYSVDMPEGILQFIDNQPENRDTQEVKGTKQDYLLNQEDILLLKKLETKYGSSEYTINKTDNLESQRCKSKLKTDKILNLCDLDWLFMHLKGARENGNDIHFHELFEGSEIVLPENEILKRNPVLEARCEKLRNQQMSREYKAMTKSVDNVRARLPEDTIAYQIKQINKQLIAVAQFLMSVAAGFLFGFVGIDLMVGPLDFGFRLLLGVIVSLIIALAEIYFLAKKLNEDFNTEEPPQIGGPLVPNGAVKLHQD